MTESEAIERIKDHFEVHHHDRRPHPYLDKAVDMAIKALEEIQQYRVIGTVEECRAAMEKHNSKESKEMPCNHCRNYYDCKSDKKDNCDSCFFLYPTKEWQMEHTEEYKHGYAKAMEECREAIEKQKAKSVIFDMPLRVLECPMCGNYVQTVQDDEGCINGTIPKYCKNCGQKLNWGDEE